MDQVKQDLKSGLGGTDAAAIVGKNPWRSPIQAWSRLMGDDPGDESSPEMKWGTIHEPAILNEFNKVWSDRTQGKECVVTGIKKIVHPEHPFLIGHLDGLTIKTNGDDIPENTSELLTMATSVVEAKTAKGFMRVKFGDPWSDEVPEQYLLQAQHYMGLTGLPVTYMPVLIEGYDFNIYVIKRNDELISDLWSIMVDWWNQYVVTRMPPPVDGSDASKKLLNRLHPTANLDNVIATTDSRIIMAAKELHEAKVQEKELKMAKQEAENIMKDAMGDAWRLEGPGFRVTWKNDKPKEKVDWERVATAVFASANIPSEQFDYLVKKHTEVKPGTRRFLFKYED